MAVMVLLGAGPSQAVLVTFQVDLSIQERIGRFDPDSDVVELRGGFNDWGGGTEMADSGGDSKIYSHEVELFDAPGALIEYKFVIVDSVGTVKWESDVGEGRSNRAFELEAADTMLPRVFFDNLATDPGAGVEVTFQVDMAARMQEGLFDPEVDTVSVRGPFNEWGSGDELGQVLAGASVFFKTVLVKFTLAGTEVPYKFIINEAEWENGDNRLFTLEEEAQTVPVRYFDDVEPEVILPLGILRIRSAPERMVTLSWDHPEAVLQGTADFEAGWDEISAAAGQTEISLSTDLASGLFFRLVSPN